MFDQLSQSWQDALSAEWSEDYIKQLESFVYQVYQEEKCYPPFSKILAAFEAFEFYKTKVVLLGQDPYHGLGQAQGYSFSVPLGFKHPPSLVNIFKEMENDLGCRYPESGDLTYWSRQGVLLLNACLTVSEKKAGSHQGKGWEEFTDAVITSISDQLEGVVFMLWGGFAKKKQVLINAKKHLILDSGHPSPLSANRGHWFGNKHFSKANAYLKTQQKTPIDWVLPSNKLF
ncbi:MAG: uracil-DNA glycosylase [Flavobacteriaceae bacterium]|nr:uracil-DNA glycosylase [Flavobacteriaceae bacterium]